MMNEYEYFDGPDEPVYQPPTPEQLREKYAYMERVFEKLDFEWLRKIFMGIAAKTSVDPEKINFVPPGQIEIDPTAHSKAYFLVDDNTITIRPQDVNISASVTHSSEALFLLESIIHEEGHAVSKIKFDGDKVNLGYAIRTEEEAKVQWAYALFDEGVNEKLTRQIMADYIKSHPDIATPQEIENFQEKYKDERSNGPYILPVSLVEAMIVKISHETLIPKQAVWEGILRGKMEGDHLALSDLHELFVQMFSQEFMQKLETLNPVKQERELGSLIKSLNISSIDPELWSRIQKRIRAREDLYK